MKIYRNLTCTLLLSLLAMKSGIAWSQVTSDEGPAPLVGSGSDLPELVSSTPSTSSAPSNAPSHDLQPMVGTGVSSSADAAPVCTVRERMNWVVAQNGGYSNDPIFPCKEGDRVCFSGLVDLEQRYYDHNGVIDFFDPSATLSGVGVRPLFGQNQVVFNGSYANANAFIDLIITSYLRLHTSLAYVGGSVAEDTYEWDYGADWGSVYRRSSGLRVDEAYMLIANPDLLNAYMKAGRYYASFGDYIPNGYGIETLVPSLTQLMTQMRTGGVEAGIIMPYGFYGIFGIMYGMQSMVFQEYPALYPTGTADVLLSNNRNYVAKLGVTNSYCDIGYNINVSYVRDIRDADYFNDSMYFISKFMDGGAAQFGTYIMNRKGGHAFHAGFCWDRFALLVEGATALGTLNPFTQHVDWPTDPFATLFLMPDSIYIGADDSRLYTLGAEGKVEFQLCSFDSEFRVGYQMARHTQVIGGGAFVFNYAPILPVKNAQTLPEYRWQFTYVIKDLLAHMNVAAQWTADHDFNEGLQGTDKWSNLALIRLDFEF